MTTSSAPVEASTLVRHWAMGFGFVFALSLVWAIASPVGSGPDEPAHVIRSASVASGELLGERVDDAIRAVEVPESLNVLNGPYVSCYAFQAQIPADCGGDFDADRTLALVNTTSGTAPPAYYVVVGGPVRLVPDTTGVYLSRALSGALIAAFVAAAFTAARFGSRAPTAVVAIFVAWTPQAAFLSGVVNPNSLEIGAAVAVWTLAYVLFAGPRIPTRAQRVLVLALVVACCAFIVSRHLSPLWLLVVGLAMLVLVEPARLLELVRDRVVQLGAAAVAVVGLVSGIWILRAGTLDGLLPTGEPDSQGFASDFLLISGRLDYIFGTAIGHFGWLDTPAPSYTRLAWTVAIGLVLVVGLAAGTTRQRIAVVGVALVTAIGPVLIETSQFGRYSFVWQGRYSLPLGVGAVILAGFAAGRLRGTARDLVRTIVVPLVWVLTVGRIVAFYFALRRYTVGTGGPRIIFGNEQWSPPLGAFPVMVLATIVMVGLGWFVIRTMAPMWTVPELVVDDDGAEVPPDEPPITEELDPVGPSPSDGASHG